MCSARNGQGGANGVELQGYTRSIPTVNGSSNGQQQHNQGYVSDTDTDPPPVYNGDSPRDTGESIINFP